MAHEDEFYIDGTWVRASSSERFEVINPATEEPIAKVACGMADDIDRAVGAAKKAFRSYSQSSARDRSDLLKSILNVYRKREGDIGAAISSEMGAPTKMAKTQSQMLIGSLENTIAILATFKPEAIEDGALIIREPIGVCGMITPWNAPVSQITGKFFAALAAGCTAVVKPSEYSPLSPLLFAEVLHEAGVPKGVFNLVNGYGHTAGAALSLHPDVDMISFTGSTKTGAAIAKAAADTVKRVHQELGGKSPNVILDDADLEKAVKLGVLSCFANSGQICAAPTRMLVPSKLQDEVLRIALKTAADVKVGPPDAPDTDLGPLVNKLQFDKVQGLIKSGIDQGAELVIGGLGRPPGLNRGYYARPTIFTRVRPEMEIAQTEIFGPVLSIMTYETDEDAVNLANNTSYGLAAYVQSKDPARALKVARQIRAGTVSLNYAPRGQGVPFGGYKRSGNGRQNGIHGLLEYFEIKAVMGAAA